MDNQMHYYDKMPEIKQLLIDAQQWRYRVDISKAIHRACMSNHSVDDQIDYAVEEAKREVLNALADRIEEFVKIEVNTERRYVEGRIHMPYVATNEMALLKTKIEIARGERNFLRNAWSIYNRKSLVGKIWMAVKEVFKS